MPVPSSIADLSTSAGSNSPAGTEVPSTLDNYQRAHASFIAQLRAVIGGATDANIPTSWPTESDLAGAVISQSGNSGTTAGTSTAYTLTPSTALAAYTANSTFWVTFHTASGASPTLQISGLSTPPNLVRQTDTGTYTNIAAGEIPANHRSRVTLLSASQALVEDMPPTPSYVSAGAIMHFCQSTAPAGWLKANGSLVSRTTYAALFAAIGTTFGVGDGSTTFALPDLRGEFIRGFDDSRGVDSGRVNGSAQSDDFKSHDHAGTYKSASTTSYTYSTQVTSGGLMDALESWGGRTDRSSKVLAQGGTETRPRNIALLACIKY